MKLAIIGASYLQLPLVVEAQKLGLETICFAWERDAVAKSVCDKFYPISITDCDAILKICDREKINGITTIASDTAVRTVNFVAEKLDLIGNSVKSSELCTNKYLMRKTLSANGLNCPFFYENTTYPDFDTVENYPLIVKPVDRSGSLGVERVENKKELDNAVLKAKNASFQGQVIIEQFIEGIEVSVETISWKGKHYHLAITDKVTTGAPNFIELEHHQPSIVTESLSKEIVKTTKRCLDALGIENGASHSEYIITDDRVYVTEIGARMGGDFIGSHLVKLSTGYDFVQGVIGVALARFTNPAITETNHSGVYFYTSEKPEVAEIIRASSRIPAVIDAGFIGEFKDKIESSGDRSGYVIYKGQNKHSLTSLRSA